MCRLAESTLTEAELRYTGLPASLYELPDGRTIDLGLERYIPPELYFAPNIQDNNNNNNNRGRNNIYENSLDNVNNIIKFNNISPTFSTTSDNLKRFLIIIILNLFI